MIERRILALVAAVGLAGAALAQDPGDILVIDVAGRNEGTVEIELLPEVAPQNVSRIKELARAGAYDGVVFHRVIDGFMAQTGDVQYGTRGAFGDGRAGTGGADLPDLPAEFSGEPFEIGFNPDFLRDGLESVEGDEVALRLISPLRPGLLYSEPEDFSYLIMPIRLAG